jgi:hypothetical protein
VLTKTVALHAAARKATFDELLAERAARTGVGLVHFDPRADYERSVDGRPRSEGVRTFLVSRGLELPEAEVTALGDRKKVRTSHPSDDHRPISGRGEEPGGYLISVSSLNIGRYIEMMMIPTIRPTPSIMIGSMIDVSEEIEASTSSS